MQIPHSVVGTAFSGSFENIPSSGAGALHTPAPGNVELPDGTTQGRTNVFAVYKNYAFQIMDQDSPPQPIRPGDEMLQITETLTDYNPPCSPELINAGQCPTSRTVQPNNAGIFFDPHGIALNTALGPETHFSVVQSLTATFKLQTFPLTPVFTISIGTFGATPNESTSTTHQ